MAHRSEVESDGMGHYTETIASMGAIQIALSDPGYCQQLRELLLSNGSGAVECVERPSAAQDYILVLDPEHLDLLSLRRRIDELLDELLATLSEH